MQLATERFLISQQAADNLQSSFSLPTLQLISRMLKGKSRQGVGFPEELKAFALTLQFYSARAYDYVRKLIMSACLIPERYLSGIHVSMVTPGFMMKYFMRLPSTFKAMIATQECLVL